MKTEPIWKSKTIETNFPQLRNELEVDVAIIGGGITGITIAQLLKQEGYRIAILESRSVGQGTSGQSTGNLYALTEYSNSEIVEKYDLETLKQVVESRTTALDFIQNTVQHYNIDCDFFPRSMYLFENDGGVDIDKEFEYAKKIGIRVLPLQHDKFPFPFHKGIEYPDQAQCNPLNYVQRLAHHIHGGNCSVFENNRVVNIEEKNDKIELITEHATVWAEHAIHATHTPMGLQIPFHTTLGPYREYGIGVRLAENQYPKGIFWGYFGDKKYSIRSYNINGEPYLLCIGSMHKVGQAKNNQKHIQELRDFVSEYFDVDHVTHQWGGQNYKSADLLPYIGAKNNGSKQYVATGFSTDGLIYGVLAGKLIADEIMGNQNPYAELYRASRHQPLKAAKKFTKENLNVAAQLIKDMPVPGFDTKDIELKKGEGKVVQVNGKKLAIHKDSTGNMTTLYAVCPHMGCIVNWNNAEQSWDCPCHGSRFNHHGSVIEGPAFNGLEQTDLS